MKKLLIMTLLASSLVGCNGAGVAPDGVSVSPSHEGGRHTERYSETQTQIKQVLTPEQAAKFEQMESQHRRSGRGGFDGQRPPQRYSDGVA